MQFLYCVLITVAISYVDSSCQLPSDLRGYDWYTTSNGKITVASDGGTIEKFDSAVTSSQLLTLTCSEYDTSTDRYITTGTTTVFGTGIKAFYCMRFTRISSDKYTVTYETDFDSTTKTRVKVISNVTGTLTPSQACALTSPLPVGTQELYVRTDALSASVISCPSSLQANLTATVQSSTCTGSFIAGADNSTRHAYTYASCVTDPFSSGGIFECMYSLVDGAYTYLAVVNKDSTVNEKNTYRFLCYIIWSSDHIVYYTYHPQICNHSQTAIDPTANGVAVVAYNSNINTDNGSQRAVGIVFSLFMLAIFVVTIVLLIIFLKPLCERKKTETKVLTEKSKGKSESKSDTKEQKPRSGKGKKKKRKKKNKVKSKKEDDENTNEQKKKLKWTDFVGISANVEEFKKPAWQVKWEQHEDPIWGKTVIEEDPESARSVSSVTSANHIVMIMPEKEEQSRARLLWEKVYRMWYEPRKPVPDKQEIFTKLSNKPNKHVRFKGRKV